MRNPNFRALLFSSAILATGLVTMISCKEDDDGPASVTVKTATTGGKDLSGSTAATGVGLTSNIVIRFSREIDAATATASAVTLTADGSTAAAAGAIRAGGDSIVFDPTNDLLSGTRYSLRLATSIKAKDGGSYGGNTFTFTTFGPLNVVPPKASNQIAYFAFNGTFNDALGTFNANAVVATTFGPDRKANAGAAAEFNGTTSIVEVPNGTNLITQSGTVSFWVKADTSNRRGLFVMGANFFRGQQYEIDGTGSWIKGASNFVYGGDSTTTEDLFFNGSGSFNGNGGWQGHTFNTVKALKTIIPNKWIQVVHTYDAATRVRTLYINGERMMQSDFNLWPTGDSKRRVTGMRSQVAADLSTTWAFGFSKGRDASFWSDTDFGDYNKPTANHFKGQLDDVRFFNTAFTAADVTTLYNAER